MWTGNVKQELCWRNNELHVGCLTFLIAIIYRVDSLDWNQKLEVALCFAGQKKMTAISLLDRWQVTALIAYMKQELCWRNKELRAGLQKSSCVN